MARNNGCLYGVPPVTYMTVSCINTPQRKTTGKYVYQHKSLRVINIGKWHVDYQLESRHGDFGKLRSAKIIKKHKEVYFVHKNRKFYLKKAHWVI